MLILVVWAISLLSVLAVGLGSRCAFALGLTGRLTQQLRASHIAAAGVGQARMVLAMDEAVSYDGSQDLWFRSDTFFNRQSFGGGYFTVAVPAFAGASPRYGLTDEESKINLNTASAEMLQRLVLAAAPVKMEDAAVVAASILDWRDADQEALPDGAENFHYLSRIPAYECKDRLFEDVAELLLVRGVAPEIFRRLSAYVTVYGSGAVNINTAAAPVLAALGLSPQGVEGLLWYRAGEDNAEGNSDDRALFSIDAAAAELGAALPAEDANLLARLAGQKLADVKSTAFSVSATAVADSEKHPFAVTAVIDRKGNTLAWQQQ